MMVLTPKFSGKYRHELLIAFSKRISKVSGYSETLFNSHAHTHATTNNWFQNAGRKKTPTGKACQGWVS
jgi:hypothetical protein